MPSIKRFNDLILVVLISSKTYRYPAIDDPNIFQLARLELHSPLSYLTLFVQLNQF